MGMTKYFAFAALLLLLPAGVQADPIDDFTVKSYRAAWFPNTQGNRNMSCADTCKQRMGGLPEYEASSVEPTKRAFVCRVQGNPRGNIRTWRYGSQFDTRAACYTTGLDLKGSYEKRFMCLCVESPKP